MRIVENVGTHYTRCLISESASCICSLLETQITDLRTRNYLRIESGNAAASWSGGCRKLKSMEIDGFAAKSGLIDSISGPAVIKNVKRVICNYRSRMAMLAHVWRPNQWFSQPQLISFRLNNICAASRGGFSGIALRVTPDKISSKAEILLTNPDRQHPINFSPRSFCASPVGWSANVLN